LLRRKTDLGGSYLITDKNLKGCRFLCLYLFVTRRVTFTTYYLHIYCWLLAGFHLQAKTSEYAIPSMFTTQHIKVDVKTELCLTYETMFTGRDAEYYGLSILYSDDAGTSVLHQQNGKLSASK